MTALSADANITTRNDVGMHRKSFQVVSSGTIYQGSLVMVANQTTGCLAAADTASNFFVGLAQKQVVNASGGTSRCEVVTNLDAYLVGSSILVTSLGSVSEVLDSATVALSGGTSNHVKVGRVEEYGDSTHAWIWLGQLV